MTKDCPLCRTGMATFYMDSLVLDRCETCEGVWFDSRELSEYGDKMSLGRMPIRPALATSESVDALVCPNCATATLTPSDQGSLTVQGCAKCGGWFLSGSEMRQLERQYTEHLLAEGYESESASEGDDRSGPARIIEAIRRFFFR